MHNETKNDDETKEITKNIETKKKEKKREKKDRKKKMEIWEREQEKDEKIHSRKMCWNQGCQIKP